MGMLPKTMKKVVFLFSVLILLIVMASFKQKEPVSSTTWLYGYGQVEKLNSTVKELVENRAFNNNKPMPYFTYNFNNKGDITQIKDNFRSDANITIYATYYNSKGNKTEAVGLYKDAGKKIKEVYHYDGNQYLTTCIGNAYNPPAEPDRFIYDKLGNLIEHQQYFEKKPLWIFKYKYIYDKNALRIGSVQSMTTWRDSFKTEAKDTSRYISFDNHNNWTKAIFLEQTIIRKITYY